MCHTPNVTKVHASRNSFHAISRPILHTSRFRRRFGLGLILLVFRIWRQDTETDLVPKTKDGEYCPIQCKCYVENHPVTMADVDTLLFTFGRKFHDFDGKETSSSLCVIVATTDNWSFNVVKITNDQIYQYRSLA